MKVKIGPYVDEDIERVLDIEIHNYDLWNLDSTLALIILPALVKFKENQHGGPYVDNDDVPEHLHGPGNPCDVDENWHPRWNWVLDEIIFSFEKKLADDTWLQSDIEKIKLEEDRIQNGFRLFGKYYQCLWD